MRKRVSGAFVWLLIISPALFAGPPKGAENEFIRVESAGLAFHNDPPRGATLGFGFAFRLKKPLTLTRVKIEDVTDRPVAVVIEDKNPKLKNSLWFAQAGMQPLTKEGFPWMYDFFDTTKVFRLTISSTEQPDIVLEQKAKFTGREKAQLMTILQPKRK
jgi:hypothetical protein